MGFIDRADKKTLDEVRIDAAYLDNHFHTLARWFGKSADQSGNNWATEGSLTPFQAISGNGAFGSDPNDEAKVIGSLDTPVRTGCVTFDPHQIAIVDASSTSVYVVRFVVGISDMATALAAGQYSDTYVMRESVTGRALSRDKRIIACPVGTKVWVQVKNATDNATLDFFLGIHEYPPFEKALA